MPRPSRRRPPPPRPHYAAACALLLCAAFLFARAFWYSRQLFAEFARALWIEHGGWYSVALALGAVALVWGVHQIERRIPKHWLGEAQDAPQRRVRRFEIRVGRG